MNAKKFITNVLVSLTPIYEGHLTRLIKGNFDRNPIKSFILWRYNCVCLLYYDTHLYYTIKFKHYIWLCRKKVRIIYYTKWWWEFSVWITDISSIADRFNSYKLLLVPILLKQPIKKVHTKTFCIAVVLWTFSSNFPYNKLKHVISLYRIFW